MIGSSELYVKACEDAYQRCVMLPRPQSHAELMALDKAHPPTFFHAGWADAFAGFVPDEWYSHRPAPPPEPKPEPPELDDSEKERFVFSLVKDDGFRSIVGKLVQEGQYAIS